MPTFCVVHLVSVRDGVDKGFFESEFDAKNFVRAGVRGPQKELLDLILEARAP